MKNIKSSTLLPAILFLCTNIAVASSDSSGEVTWMAPSKGDVYGPGDSIVGQWTAENGKHIVSPSFKLCQCDGTCGTAIWPDVVQAADASSSVKLVAPNVTETACYMLEMIDNFETSHPSPQFSISSTASTTEPAQSPSTASDTTPQPSAAGPDSLGSQAPLASPDAPQAPLGVPPSPIASANPSADAAPLAPPAMAAPTPPIATATPPTNILATRIPPPTAAFAVPLSAVGAILVVAGVLWARSSRKLTKERVLEAEKLSTASRRSSYSSKFEYSKHGDLERALGGLSKHHIPYAAHDTPMFVSSEHVRGSDRRQPRRATRQAFVGHPSDPYTQSPCGSYRSSRASSPSHTARSSRFMPQRSRERYQVDEEYGGVTGSVIGDYMEPEHAASPPRCLLPAPQRVYVRSPAAPRDIPHSDYDDSESGHRSVGDDDYSDMVEVDLYDAVASNLRMYQR